MTSTLPRRWTATPSANTQNPEDDLTEWTNRIKAIQRAVDEDEEAEQKRLEEEIKASRLARTRRKSIGMTPSVTGSDPIPRPLSRGYRERADSPTSPYSESREKNQSDALRRLIGDSTDQSTPTSPTRIRTTSMMNEPLNQPSLSAAKFSSASSAQSSSARSVVSSAGSTASAPASSKREPMSLAAFMGGTATGPRLRKHAPQQDAHDPTQFAQVTSASITAPHPIFGRGGIAMPGLVEKGRGAGSLESRGMIPSGKEVNSSYNGNEVVSTTKVDDNRKSYGGIAKAAPPVAPKPVSISLSRSVSSGVRSEISALPTTPPRSKTPTHITPRTMIQPQHTSSASSITMGSLARPIQPDPRPSPQGPSISSSNSPSPAFLRAPAPKQLTPSLSRLQGRGFVQSLVKMSDDLEAAASPERLTNSAKRNSVHDRWQPAVSETPSPTTAVSLRKAKTFDYNTGPTSPTPSKETSKPVMAKEQSLPPPITAPKPKLISPEAPSPSTPGLGSKNTMISYIKPTKTGDAPATDNTSSVAQSISAYEAKAGMDEFGVRTRVRSNPSSAVGVRLRQSSVGREKANRSEIPPAVGKPLNHLTKDRAKKPRKGAGRATTADSEPLTPSPDSTDDPQETMSASSHMRPLTSTASHEPVQTSATVGGGTIVAEPKQILPSNLDKIQGENVRQMIGSWGVQAPIGVKDVSKRSLPLRDIKEDNYNGGLTRRALPGLTVTEFPPTSPMEAR